MFLIFSQVSPFFIWMKKLENSTFEALKDERFFCFREIKKRLNSIHCRCLWLLVHWLSRTFPSSRFLVSVIVFHYKYNCSHCFAGLRLSSIWLNACLLVTIGMEYYSNVLNLLSSLFHLTLLFMNLFKKFPSIKIFNKMRCEKHILVFEKNGNFLFWLD